MTDLYDLDSFLDRFNEIFGEKAEYEIKSMLDDTITVKMIYKRALPPAQFQPGIPNPFDNIVMDGLVSLMYMTDTRRLKLRLNVPAMEKLTFQLRLATRHSRKPW